MFGRLPWLAFERRIRAFFFLVFFDMSDHSTLCEVPGTRPTGALVVCVGVGWFGWGLLVCAVDVS